MTERCMHASLIPAAGGNQCAYCPEFFPTFQQETPAPGERPYFGAFFDHLYGAEVAGGSELALGLELFTRTVISHAKTILETGRFKGFSGLAIASGMRLLDQGWQDPTPFHNRPDVDYKDRLAPCERKLYSVDIAPDPIADLVWERAGLTKYIEKIDCSSADVDLSRIRTPLDGAFIDGDHSLEGCEVDINKFGALVKPGGWIVLHDYFGWWINGVNGSPIKIAAERLGETRMKNWIMVDSGSCSFAVFRKPDPRMGI